MDSIDATKVESNKWNNLCTFIIFNLPNYYYQTSIYEYASIFAFRTIIPISQFQHSLLEHPVLVNISFIFGICSIKRM